jgi:hypothetical protein
MYRRIGFLVLITCLFSVNVASQATASNLDSSVSTSGDFVLGRLVTSTFEYDINDPYVPVDTALVIDESGSMSGVMEDAKDGAKSYVDSTNTGQGDRNAVVEFESSANLLQGLTSSKQDARDEIDTISAGGGTDLSAGVSQAENELTGVSDPNPTQVMIVLADGGGGNPNADSARNAGIEIHGIMYGSGASTSEFESLTGASECTTDSSENTDGDKCWYAESGTIDSVYTSIRQSTEAQTDVELSMRLRDFAYIPGSPSNDLPGNNQEVVRNYNDVDAGSYDKELDWRPTTTGLSELVTGDSVLEVTSEGETTDYYFSGSENRDVEYVDFNVKDASMLRRDSKVNVNFTVENIGTVSSRQREVWLSDGTSMGVNRESFNVPELSAGAEEDYSLTFDTATTSLFNNPEDIYVRVDPSGYWNSRPYGTGDTLEPDEGNNIANLGYPPRLNSANPVSPDGVSWGDTIQPSFTYEHSDSGTVSGVYNYSNQSVQMESSEPISSSTSSGDDVLTTQEDYFIDFAERWYNFTVRATGGEGAVSVYEVPYFVENPKPTASAINPGDGDFISEFPVRLRSRVEDENSEYHSRYLDVTFYDSNGNQLDSTSIMPGDTHTYEWDVPDAGDSEYDWTVEVEDKWDIEAFTFSFTKIIGQRFRTSTRTDLNYSSLVLNAGTNKYAELTIQNQVSNEKNLTLSLSGVEAEFLDGSDTKQLPNFEGQSQETFTIRVNPDEPVSGNVDVNVRNNNLNIDTTESLSVRAIESVAQSNREVPGIGLIQLVFLFSAATVLYSVRL